MNRIARVPLIILALMLLASCGKQHQAKTLVKQFMDDYASTAVHISSFSKLDSTRVISDSLLQAMRRNGQHDTLFKKDISYTAERQGPTLYFIRMRYQQDTLELSKTFYFNPEIDGIIAFK